MPGASYTGPFIPTAMDAYAALLGQMPAALGQAIAHKQQTRRLELEQGRNAAAMSKLQLQRAKREGAEASRQPTIQRRERAMTPSATALAERRKRELLAARSAKIKAFEAAYGGPTSGSAGATALDELYQQGMV